MTTSPDAAAADFLARSYALLREHVSARGDATTTTTTTTLLPSASALEAAHSALPRPTDADYLAPRGAQATHQHMLSALAPALTGQNLSGRYFGFVTGSSLPVAEAADNIVSALDQNVAVHLPSQSVATAVEDAALTMLLTLLDLDDPTAAAASAASAWPVRIFTTGATASNVLGLAVGREAVVSSRVVGGADAVAELGLVEACRRAGLQGSGIQVLTSLAHSSLYKAASIVGLGRASVKELPLSEREPWRLDLHAVERELVAADAAKVASIIVVSAGEVNTGRFATAGRADMERLRSLADKYGAHIHVDGAFGIFARALPKTPEFASLHDCVDGLELADSITADGHKLLNVPYDTGIFFSKAANTQTQVFENPNAAYLASQDDSEILSPLNTGIENSRRFRALPVYAVLLSEGREGMVDMFVRMVRFARQVTEFLQASVAYQCLPNVADELEQTHIIVLFRAKDVALNEVLVEKINETRRMYVSGTQWRGQKACRLAVSSWRIDAEKDLPIVKDVLTTVAATQLG